MFGRTWEKGTGQKQNLGCIGRKLRVSGGKEKKEILGEGRG